MIIFTMDFKFDDGQMRAIVTKAIVEGMGDEQKTLILQKAVEHLMGPANPNSYNDKRSKLEAAFDDAASYVLERIANEELAKPEFEEKIRSLFVEVANKVFSEGQGREKLRDALTNAIHVGMKKMNDY